MELFEPGIGERRPFTTAPLVARFAPVFWEPVAGTGERIVALMAVEPHEETLHALGAATYVVLNVARLKSMLGRVRGQASESILRAAASFMTERQRAGLPLGELRAPFHGFVLGPVQVARGNALEQLLDGAVRSASAFGSAEEMVEGQEADEPARHTLRTASFIARLRTSMGAAIGPESGTRFDKRLRVSLATPEVTVDYAFGSFLVQVTSLPLTPKQAVNSNREAQSKLLELLLVQRAMDNNLVHPTLLVNEDARQLATDAVTADEIARAQERLIQLTNSFDTALLWAHSVDDAARQLVELSPESGTPAFHGAIGD